MWLLNVILLISRSDRSCWSIFLLNEGESWVEFGNLFILLVRKLQNYLVLLSIVLLTVRLVML